MKRLMVVIAFLVALMAFFTRIDFIGIDSLIAESMMALGFTLIVAYLVGKIVTRFQLPKITGYIVAGILVGPFIINLLSEPVVQNLQLIDSIALSLIALTAGGEFRYKTIKKQLKTIGNAILWKTIIVLLGFIIFFLLYRSQVNFLQDSSLGAVIGVGMILGALSVATSPATTIAVITETKAAGRFTDFVLGVTVLKDIVVVLIFSLALSIAKPMILGESGLKADYIYFVFKEMLLSVGIGFVAGVLILLYLKYVDKQRTLFLLGFMLFGIEFARMVHAEIVLIFMVAGFFVQNFSDSGAKLIDAIEESSLPIFVIFFAIAGASLNFPLFLENWLLALILVGLRMLTTFQGTYLGGKLTGAPEIVNRYGWMGFIGQAGLSLGLSVLVTRNIPGAIGVNIRTLIISTIAINQIIGPILFRYSLSKAGEIR